MQKQPAYLGIIIALVVLSGWATSTILLMRWQVSYANPLLYVFILLQMHLYTGLFITAHDAMHGTVSSNRAINNAVGYAATFFYAAFWYGQLYTKHHRHHRHVHTDADPDYNPGDFFTWYASFIRNYLSIWQIIFMAILFNVLKIWVPQANLLLFWVLPSLLSTLQLFYFGTYLPHKGEHSNQHQSGSQPKNHVWAFLSCYFFGYHYEHHDSPATPWWLLWKLK
ncbi:fatty acid desaturase [uncultured Mucilaginibacter sp.]|uniref:fatty acid desaturase n=1 Tax=uncultured Mucilaginibacter sp. TaxID=797541 RepID=UPI0025E29B15|nr:fatty acid desaturase [uncultured Mucilaginibacter sp.]